jgi:cytochrome d ubiquinol oxidase subunit I
MVGFGVYFLCFTGLGLLLLWRKRLFESHWFLKLAVLSIPLPIIANELGWIAAEMGRQPWVVQGLLRTEDAVSKIVPAGQILATIVGFSLVYAALFAIWIFLLARKMRQGPEEPGAKAGDSHSEEAY